MVQSVVSLLFLVTVNENGTCISQTEWPLRPGAQPIRSAPWRGA